MNPLQKIKRQHQVISEKNYFHRLLQIATALTLAFMGWGAPLPRAEADKTTDSGERDEEKLSPGINPRGISSDVGREQMVLTNTDPRNGKEAAVFLVKTEASEDIFAAAIAGHSTIVPTLLKQEPKRVNLRDCGGKTALHWAALHGQKNVATVLLAQKAEVNALDAEGFTALH